LVAKGSPGNDGVQSNGGSVITDERAVSMLDSPPTMP